MDYPLSNRKTNACQHTLDENLRLDAHILLYMLRSLAGFSYQTALACVGPFYVYISIIAQ